MIEAETESGLGTGILSSGDASDGEQMMILSKCTAFGQQIMTLLQFIVPGSVSHLR